MKRHTANLVKKIWDQQEKRNPGADTETLIDLVCRNVAKCIGRSFFKKDLFKAYGILSKKA